MRPTTRRLTIAVAVVAVSPSGPKTAAWPRDGTDEAINEPFAAVRTTSRAWDLGPATEVTVDSFEGSIRVEPSGDGRVAAEVTAAPLAEDFRSAAAEGLRTIAAEFDHRGDTLRIAARGRRSPVSAPGAEADPSIPSNVRLDLRKSRGDGRVGCGARRSRANLAPIWPGPSAFGTTRGTTRVTP